MRQCIPNLMKCLWTSKPSLSKADYIVKMKLTPYESSKSITIWGAYQAFWKKIEKEVLSNRKVADLVILDQNPLKIEPHEVEGYFK